jgi:tungstate transport system ATP-binding protein
MLYELEAVTCVRGGRRILDIPALSLPTGRIYSLIGPNGAGKTTLLHLLAFLDAPTTGAISFCSVPVRQSEKTLLPLRRKVVLLDQYPILFTGPVWKNLDFGLKVRKVERKRRKGLIEEALAQVGMLDFFYARADTLSGGETKRVALARALVVQPRVLLCDEPTANVDAENRTVILDILERVNREQDISIIFATHSQSQARRISGHTLILKDGRLSDLPRDNVFLATIVDRSEGKAVCLLQNGIRIRIPLPEGAAPARSIRLFLDPDRLTLLRRPAAGTDDDLLAGRVYMIAAESGQIRISVDIGLPVHAFLSRSDYAQDRFFVGEKIFLRIGKDSVVVE